MSPLRAGAPAALPKRLKTRLRRPPGSASLPRRGPDVHRRRGVAPIRQPTAVISFEQLIGAGGKEGARTTFERLIAQLVGLSYAGMKKIEAKSGDWGLDVIVGEIDDILSVWQAKFFIDGVGDPQKAQIRESLKQVIEKAGEEGFTVNVWTLCVPIDLDPEALKWWTGWKKRRENEHHVRIELLGRTGLEALLLTPDAAHILRAYFPAVAVPAAAPPAVQDVPDDVSYEDMLFVKQLQTAQIVELESAKQQFFNAEALSREVADKKVGEHIDALRAERADLRSIWEDRYNKACAESHPTEGLLPELHPDVMEAIERRHDSGRIEVLPMHLIHRKGAMHQVVEDGSAGWVRDFRGIVEAHRG
jgi:hypothetical protein